MFLQKRQKSALKRASAFWVTGCEGNIVLPEDQVFKQSGTAVALCEEIKKYSYENW